MEIKDQAIIVQILFGSYKKITSGEKFWMFSLSRVSNNWSLCPNSNILSVIRTALVSWEKYSQYKQVLEVLIVWLQGFCCSLWWHDAPELQLAKSSPYWWMRFIVFWIIHRAKMKSVRKECIWRRIMQHTQNTMLFFCLKIYVSETCLHGYIICELLYTQNQRNASKQFILALLDFTGLWCWVYSRRVRF